MITNNANEKNKIIFWGTPNFAAIILNSLIKNNYRPMAVVTAPDQPVGRKQILTASPVKVLAQKYNILVLQPKKIKDNRKFNKEILSLKPNLFIVAAYGLIFPQEILILPQKRAINVHPSLLPKYRGPSPIQYAILNGDQFSGVSLALTTKKVDAGPIIAQKKLAIKNQSYLELSDELARLGAKLLIKVLPDYLQGKIKPVPQNESEATYTQKIKKEDGLINFNKTAQQIVRQIRAFYPWPGTYIKIFAEGRSKTLKILEAEILSEGNPTSLAQKTGQIFEKNKQLVITCVRGSLILKKVQLEGKKEMTGKTFFNGHQNLIGQIV